MKIKTTFKIAALSLFIGLTSCKDDDNVTQITPPVETADFKVTTHGDGHPEIIDNQTLTYNVLGDESELGFYVTNLTDTTSYYKITCESLTNTTGFGFQFCWGICLPEVVEGTTYPLDEPISINPGETQASSGDHFKNDNTGIDTSASSDYTLLFFQTDADGTEIVGADTVTFTYRYTPQS